MEQNNNQQNPGYGYGSYPNQQQFYQEESIDIKKYLFMFLDNWYWFAISLTVSLTIAFLVNRYTIPTYQVSSSLIIEERPGVSDGVQSVISELGIRRSFLQRAQIENEIAILKSYKYAKRAISELDFGITYMGHGRIKDVYMYGRAPFTVIPDTSKNNLIAYPVTIRPIDSTQYELEINDNYGIKKVIRYGEKFESDIFNFKLVKSPFGSSGYSEYTFRFNNTHALVNQYRGKLNIEANSEKGSVLILSMSGFVPEQEADYLNKLMEVYLKIDLEEKNAQSQRTIDFIDHQIEIIKDSLENAENSLMRFRINNQVINIQTQSQTLLNQLNDLNSKKQNVYIKRQYIEETKKYLEGNKASNSLIVPSTIGIPNQSLNQLVSEYNSLITDLKALDYSVNKSTPDYVIKQEQLDNIKALILENIVNDEKTVMAEINEIENQENQLEEIVAKLPINEQQLINIQREYELQNGLYNFLLEKKAEQGIIASTNRADNTILDLANPANAKNTGPKKKQNKMLGFIIGLLLPAGALLILDFFNDKIQSKNDIEGKTDIPIIGLIGHNDRNTELPLYEYPQSGLAESFRGLRTGIEYMLEDVKTIMVTSSISGEGKTFITANLAAAMAMKGKKIALLGLDLRRPGIHKIMEVDNTRGLSTYLAGKSSLHEIKLHTKIENLHIYPPGPVPPNPAELIGNKHMKEAIEKLSKEYDHIILDTPPVAVVSDAMELDKYVDFTLFIIRQNFTSKQIFDLLNSFKTRNLFKRKALLVNDVKTKSYYGYQYTYGYGYQYGYYYRKE